MRVELDKQDTSSVRHTTMNRKGEADMWWIIAGALLVLIVVVVLLTFFSRGTQKAEAGLAACETTGGQCVLKGDCRKLGGNPTSPALFECEDKESYECCFGMKKPLTGNS